MRKADTVRAADIVIEMRIRGEEVIEKEVKPHGRGAHVMVPKRWLGSKVKLIKLAEEDKKQERR